MAICEPCLYFLFEARALQLTSASQAGMITAMLPLLVAILAWGWLKERISRQTLLGFMLAIGPYWLGQTYGLKRGYIWAVFFVLGGIAMPVFSIESGYQAVGLLCTVMGLLTLTSGAFMFLRFIRRYPVADQEVSLKGG